MHEPIDAFVECAAESFEPQGPIYEVGYSPAEDLPDEAPGSGGVASWDAAFEGPAASALDRLENITSLPYADAAARTVVAVGALEHAFEPQRAAAELTRILAPGGLLLIGSAANAKDRSLPRYWQPTPRAFQRLLAPFEATLIGWQGPNESPDFLFAIACKPPVGEAFFGGIHRFLDGFPKRLDGTASRRRRPWSLGRLIRRLWGKPADPERPGSRATQFVLHLPVHRQLKHELLAVCTPEENLGSRLDRSG